jgi:hypothetical protein
MELEKLLEKIKQETEKEELSLKKEHDLEIEKINQEKQTKLDSLKQVKEKELETEKEKLVFDYRKNRKFQLEMELLEMKREIIKEKADLIKEKAGGLEIAEKRKIFNTKLEQVKDYPGLQVFVSPGTKGELFSWGDVEEKDIGFKDGFIAETDKVFLEVSLDSLINEALKNDYGFLAQVLFKN